MFLFSFSWLFFQGNQFQSHWSFMFWIKMKESEVPLILPNKVMVALYVVEYWTQFGSSVGLSLMKNERMKFHCHAFYISDRSQIWNKTMDFHDSENEPKCPKPFLRAWKKRCLTYLNPSGVCPSRGGCWPTINHVCCHMIQGVKKGVCRYTRGFGWNLCDTLPHPIIRHIKVICYYYYYLAAN